MAIQFCPTCKNILTIETKDSSQYLTCKTCQTQKQIEAREHIVGKSKVKQKEIGQGAAEKITSGHDFKCKECGNTNCKLVDLGMMIGDEDWVYLLQCTKCDYAERVGEWC